jgi:ABC-type branched-subunit amino acid transport system ATPase component
MLEPAVFLLDEPTANLAPQVATELLTGHVGALAEAGTWARWPRRARGCWP